MSPSVNWFRAGRLGGQGTCKWWALGSLRVVYIEIMKKIRGQFNGFVLLTLWLRPIFCCTGRRRNNKPEHFTWELIDLNKEKTTSHKQPAMTHHFRKKVTSYCVRFEIDPSKIVCSPRIGAPTPAVAFLRGRQVRRFKEKKIIINRLEIMAYLLTYSKQNCPFSTAVVPPSATPLACIARLLFMHWSCSKQPR